jgi:DNA-binding XRE family transcriptional regulator
MSGEIASPPVVNRSIDVRLAKRTLSDKGLTPETVAPLIGVGRNTPRRWITEGIMPGLDRAQRFADVLELTVDQLWPRVKVAE